MVTPLNREVETITTPSRLTKIVSLVASFTSLAFAIVTYYLMDIKVQVPIVFVVFSVVNVIVYWIFKVTENLKLVYWLTSSLIFTGVFIISLFSGGIMSTFSFFMPIVVISGYSMNLRYGNRWLVVCMLAFMALYWVDSEYIATMQAVPVASQAPFSLLAMLLATVMLCAIYGRYLSNSIYKSLKKTAEIGEKNKENEALLEELQKRVKGNLKTIGDLLSLQAQFADEHTAKEHLDFSQYRVYSMALIHKMLYQSDKVSQINFKEYVQKLSQSLLKSLGAADQISVHIESEDIYFNMDTAVPLGLLTNEILTHAFMYSLDNRKGSVHIKLDRLHFKNFILEIGDNGKGVSSELEIDTIGHELIESLARKLNGHVEAVDPQKSGANFMVVFQEV